MKVADFVIEGQWQIPVIEGYLVDPCSPSRSFILWRFAHNKLHTYDNLRKRRCCIVSICCFCHNQAESSHHIFLSCPVTMVLWDWLNSEIGSTGMIQQTLLLY